MLAILAGLIFSLSMAECWAAQPYEPVQTDPVLEEIIDVTPAAASPVQ